MFCGFRQTTRSGSRTTRKRGFRGERHAQSKSDFTAKLQIALKEAAKTQYRLEILNDAELVKSDKAFDSLCNDRTELIKILTSSAKTARANNITGNSPQLYWRKTCLTLQKK